MLEEHLMQRELARIEDGETFRGKKPKLNFLDDTDEEDEEEGDDGQASENVDDEDQENRSIAEKNEALSI